MKYARIEEGTVRELIDFDPTDRFHPSLIWVQCPDDTAQGDLYDGTFSKPPPPPPPTVEELARIAARQQLQADRTAALAYNKLIALSDLTPAQIQTWIDANVTNLATAQDAIKTLAVGLSILIRRERL